MFWSWSGAVTSYRAKLARSPFPVFMETKKLSCRHIVLDPCSLYSAVTVPVDEVVTLTKNASKLAS